MTADPPPVRLASPSRSPARERRDLRTFLALCALVLPFFLSACANYQLGPGSTPTFRTLYVEPVANKTLLPQAQPILSTQLRETFARDGRVALAASSAADATLTVVIDDYRREVAAVREGDTGLARKFNVYFGATCTLRDNRTGKLLFQNRAVLTTREIFTDSGQLQAEYQILPLLAESLSAKIAHAALDIW